MSERLRAALRAFEHRGYYATYARDRLLCKARGHDYQTVCRYPEGPWIMVEQQVCVRVCCWGSTGRTLRLVNT